MNVLNDPNARLNVDLGEQSESLLRRIRSSRFAARAVGIVIQTLLPPVCAGCGVSGHWMCPACDANTRQIVLTSVCIRCGHPDGTGSVCSRCEDWNSALMQCRSTYVFNGAVRQMIYKLKYQGEFARSEWCGRELARLVTELKWRPDVFVPVPLHSSRVRTRGYNQSAKVAEVVSSMLSIPNTDALTRTRATVSQVGLDVEQRRENVLDAFSCDHNVAGRSVVLIDDVVTTGATLDACAYACWLAGATSVRAVTVATATNVQHVQPG